MRHDHEVDSGQEGVIVQVDTVVQGEYEYRRDLFSAHLGVTIEEYIGTIVDIVGCHGIEEEIIGTMTQGTAITMRQICYPQFLGSL